MVDDNAPTVLIVEDDVQLLDLFRQFLEGRYAVQTATSGQAALEQVDGSVDLVLLDRRMPGLSGDEVLEELRGRGYDVPVAMVTAVDPDLDIVDLPFDDYVVKPVNRVDLESIVESVLSRRAYDESVREFFAIGSKVAALETDHSRAELDRNDRYRELKARLANVRQEARSTLAALSADEIERLFRNLESPDFRRPDRNDDTSGEF